LCDLSAERIRRDEVGERALALDLDHREQLAVLGLQLGLSADVDLLELEAELGLRRLDDTARRRAQVAALGGVEDDARYG
jgi:hypothetical protein